MADLSITAASVLAGSGASVKHGVAGATVIAGEVAYLDSVTNTYKLADCDSGTAALRSPAAFALHGSLAGQPLAVLSGGPITLGAVLTPGVAYYLSGTPGKVCPVADLASGDYPTILGIAISTTVLNVKIQESGVAL